MSNTLKLSWESSILELYKGKKVPKSLIALEQSHVKNLRDLIWTLPSKFYPITENPEASQCADGDIIRISGTLQRVTLKPIFMRKMRLFQIRGFLQTDQDIFPLIWFNAYPNIKEKIWNAFQDQTIIKLDAPVKRTGPFLQLVNSKFVKDKDLSSVQSLEYPTINKVKGHFIEKLIKKIPDYLWDNIPELPNQFSLKSSFQALHQYSPLEFDHEYLSRIKYQEFFEDQLKIKIRKEKKLFKKIEPLNFTENDFLISIKIFSYSLTVDQLQTYKDIVNDLKQDTPMLRLIQGDVGCGKTSLAISAMKLLFDKNLQSAFMAPTENLAFQHYKTLQDFFPIEKIAFLCSSVKSKEKEVLLNEIESGERTIIIGTHSLFQEKVIYKNLNLTIIDEQHKFGVDQRIQFLSKAIRPHCILLSATPIPRTLSLTIYGDLDISTIMTMPSNRKGFKTRIVEKINFSKYLNFIKTRLDLKEQVYVVLPNIEKSETRNTLSIEEVSEIYRSYFPEIKIEVLHGQMKSDEQKKVIANFRENITQLIVSTTVIEVGIHVSNATVMSIYHPEFFGLSSLHQLRGRVGRDIKPGFCFLIQGENLSKSQEERLTFFEKHEDGFDIASEDLKVRGEGDLFGKLQSGSSQSRRISSLLLDEDIFNNVIEAAPIYFKNTAILKEQAEFMTISKDPYILTSV